MTAALRWSDPRGRQEGRRIKDGSLCKTCSMMREVVTPRGSRFLLCTKWATDQRYSKYPPQPIARCEGYRAE
jgi:hypothetical protein